MLLLGLAALIPPPIGWETPRASGPGLFCGNAFVLPVNQGESIWQEWPGEMRTRDVYGTYHLQTEQGEVVVTEHGPRSIPEGSVHAVPLGPALGFSVYDDKPNVYRLSTPGRGNVTAVVVRFSDTTSGDEASAILRRFRPAPSRGTACLAPQNR